MANWHLSEIICSTSYDAMGSFLASTVRNRLLRIWLFYSAGSGSSGIQVGPCHARVTIVTGVAG